MLYILLINKILILVKILPILPVYKHLQFLPFFLPCLKLCLFSSLRYVHLDPLWADFQGTPSTGSRPIPFVDALPASLWLYKQPEENQAPNSRATSLKQPPPLPKRSKAPAGPSRQTSKTGKNI